MSGSVNSLYSFEGYKRPAVREDLLNINMPPLNGVGDVITSDMLPQRNVTSAVDSLGNDKMGMPILTPPSSKPNLAERNLVLDFMRHQLDFEAQTQMLLLDISKRNFDICKELQMSTIKENLKLAEKAEKAQAKAREKQRKFGLFTKIFGAILTGVGLVAGICSGGAGLVISVIGLSLMAADTITKKATGYSFMDQAMHWVGGKLGKAIEAIAHGLQKLGVPALAARIISAVGVAITVCVLVFVGAKSATKLLGMVMKNVFNKLLAQFSKNLTGLTTQAAKRNIFAWVEFSADAGQGANTAAHSTGDCITAGLRKTAAGFNARMATLSASKVAMKSLQEGPAEQMNQSFQRQSNSYQLMKNMIASQDRACRSILAATPA